MPSITPKPAGAAVNFITLKNPVQVPQQTVEEVTKPGEPGVAYRLLGKRGKTFDVLGIVDSNDANSAESTLTQLANMVGGLSTVVDDHGQSFPDVMILDVQREDVRAIRAAAGGISATKGYLLSVRITCQIASES